MTTTHSVARNTAKAAKAYVKRFGKILVRFEKPAGYNENKVRSLKPMFSRNSNIVAVRAFNGLWAVTATVIPHGNLRNCAGRLYKACISFDAQHVAWFDETGPMTPLAMTDAVNRHVYQNR